MTALDLVHSIFGRAQGGVPGNQRIITPAQLSLLRKLLDEDGERVTADGPGRQMWLPAGRDKYVLAEDLGGKRHTLTRYASVQETQPGRLF